MARYKNLLRKVESNNLPRNTMEAVSGEKSKGGLWSVAIVMGIVGVMYIGVPLLRKHKQEKRVAVFEKQ